MILETIFIWTGGLALIILSICIILIGLFYLFNIWLEHYAFCWRISFIAFASILGAKKLMNQEMTDKDGTKFKLIEVKDE